MATRGLAEYGHLQKPVGMTSEEFFRLQSRILSTLDGEAGFGYLGQKNYAAAQQYLRQAVGERTKQRPLRVRACHCDAQTKAAAEPGLLVFGASRQSLARNAAGRADCGICKKAIHGRGRQQRQLGPVPDISGSAQLPRALPMPHGQYGARDRRRLRSTSPA